MCTFPVVVVVVVVGGGGRAQNGGRGFSTFVMTLSCNTFFPARQAKFINTWSPPKVYIRCRPVASQPGGGGVWTWMGGTPGAPPPPWTLPAWRHQFEKRPHSWTFTSTPPLDIARVTSSIWKTPPLFDIHKHPPLDIARVTSSIFQGWNKIAKGWNKIAEGWNKIAKGWNKIAEGWNKIAKGWNKIAERWNKIAKGWNKIAKGWNKIFGMGNWGGGSYDPPDPPWLRAWDGYVNATNQCLYGY